MVALEPIQINLAGGHYLRVGVALQLTEAAHEADGSKALDATIAIFSGLRDGGGGLDPKQREHLKKELLEELGTSTTATSWTCTSRSSSPSSRQPDRQVTSHSRSPQVGSRGADTHFVTLFAPSTAAQRPGSAGVRARRRSGRAAEPVAYDFRRPIQLSREHSRILQLGLDGFARQATTVFTSALRTVCSVQLLSIEPGVLRRVRRLARRRRRT